MKARLAESMLKLRMSLYDLYKLSGMQLYPTGIDEWRRSTIELDG
ncbi:hypothetical protein MCEREM21A_00955 [Sphingomonadaceae bacterium]